VAQGSAVYESKDEMTAKTKKGWLKINQPFLNKA